MNSVLSALIEAWGEIRINKGRFILSLTGVTVAVWAMATVLALGGMLTYADEYFRSINGMRPGLITLDAYPSEQQDQMFDYGYGFAGQMGPMDPMGPEENPLEKEITLVEDMNGQLTSVFGAAARQTAADLKVTTWTRYTSFTPEVRSSSWSSVCNHEFPETCWDNGAFLAAVDPDYFKLYAKEIIHGRGLTDSDALLQMNPVVINEKLWDSMGKPALQSYPRLIVTGDPGLTLTVVGVLKKQSSWEQNEMYMHFDGLMSSKPHLKGMNGTEFGTGQLKLLVPVGEEEHASKVAEATLGSRLGPDYTADAFYSHLDGDMGMNEQAIITTVVSIIGGIVILLGAFGMLTVSIVTIRHRIREIGIRRAMGASARRVFFSVFLESVVATTAAGFVGVMLSVFTIRFVPADLLDFPISLGSIPYPMTAALLGVLIAAGVGALAGIIPAVIAVKVKPIDAIRY
ncbi:MAG: ABC transporter permease [Actinomycetaceae bacterium]|nr:ABC transporter permease [Actinomycetaceae bacterium]